MSVIDPILTECRYGCPWEITADNDTDKAKKEAAHALTCRRAPLSTAQDVAALVTADPSHDRDVEAIVSAIELDANANSGEVDPNRVRQLLPDWVHPQTIGAVYTSLTNRGVLSRCGWTTNKDRKGRNIGKPIPLYSYNFQRVAS